MSENMENKDWVLTLRISDASREFMESLLKDIQGKLFMWGWDYSGGFAEAQEEAENGTLTQPE